MHQPAWQAQCNMLMLAGKHSLLSSLSLFFFADRQKNTKTAHFLRKKKKKLNPNFLQNTNDLLCAASFQWTLHLFAPLLPFVHLAPIYHADRQINCQGQENTKLWERCLHWSLHHHENRASKCVLGGIYCLFSLAVFHLLIIHQFSPCICLFILPTL